MKPKTILTAGPTITQREIDYVLDAVSHGWNENWDGYLRRFEKEPKVRKRESPAQTGKDRTRWDDWDVTP